MAVVQQVTWHDFAMLLRRIRRREGLSQAQLADLFACDRTYIWRLEHQLRRPSKRFLRSLVRACNLDEIDASLVRTLELMAAYRCESLDTQDGTMRLPRGAPRRQSP